MLRLRKLSLMKKMLFVSFALCLIFTAYGQADYKKNPSLGVQFFFNDFKSAASLRSNGLSSVLRSKQWNKTQSMNAGMAISYMQGLSDHLDFAGTLSGSFLSYPIPGKPVFANPTILLEGAASVNLKLLSDKYRFSPFLTAGAGVSKYRGYYAAFIPVGLGGQLRIFEETFLIVSSQYRVAVTENAAYHFYHSLGVFTNLTTKKEPAPVVVPIPVVEPPKDRDGDGILDDADKCPDVKGLAALQGCPDGDGDGITDAEDKCPDVAGFARYQGCPIPDTDKDAINDELDKCPTVFGYARYQGCPIPDTDGDGVNDEEDKCIKEAGPATNFGCPIISEVIVEKMNVLAKRIYFETGKYKLLAKSNTPLNEITRILNENPSFNVEIDGHTDDVGNDEKNQILSENRAASVKAYFVGKGIAESRLTSTGYGETKPLADNKKAAGRAQNRRVSLHLKNY